MRTICKICVGTLLGALLLTMVGCGQEETESAIQNNATTSTTAIAETNATTSETTAAEKNVTDSDNSESLREDTTEDSVPTDNTSEETNEVSSTESAESGLTPEEVAAKESYEHWDAYCNSNALDLTPMEGDFMALDPAPEDAFPYISSPDGDVFGFYDDLTDGCSVWCAIDYESYINDISATSTLAPQGNNSYDASNLGNRSRKDAWVEGVDGYGIGESVTIIRKYSHGGDAAGFLEHGYDSFFFPNLCIVNGMAKSEKAWKSNSRVKSLKLYFNDEYVATLELEDSMKPQFISLSGLHLSASDSEESSFRFEIADVYPGDKYDDTALTGIEIEVFTENH